MEQGAVQLIQDTAVQAHGLVDLNTDKPAGFYQGQIIDLEHLQSGRSRFRGTYATQSMQDFMAYVIARDSAQGFIDPDNMKAVAFFNLLIGANGTPQTPGHADHRAVLTLPRSAAFQALVGACSFQNNPRPHTQKTLAEFLEDWQENLQADYVDPAPTSDPTQISRAITAVRNVKIKARGESTHVESDFGRQRSAMEDVEASSEHVLPAGFRFQGVPYEGLEPITAYVRLGVLTDDEKPRFVLRIRAYESLVEQIGQDFKAKLLAGIGDKATMLLGTFDPGK